MGIVTSGQIAVKPVRVATSATLEQIAKAAARRLYPQQTDRPSTGWGSIFDDEGPLNLPVSMGIRTNGAEVETDLPTEPSRRLRLRYYWAVSDARAQRMVGDAHRWSQVNMLNAADLIFYEEREGSYTVLITMRTPSPFNTVVAALKSLLLTIDDRPLLVSDTIPEALSEDFFLWLIDTVEGDVSDEDAEEEDDDDGIRIVAINEISSKDRQFRSARFKDSANAERIELAALIGKGISGFGPAKVTLTSEQHAATFIVEFHLDGGFQPLRTSEYDDADYGPVDFGLALVDDIWTSILPTLRDRYDNDDAWGESRRAALRESAIDTICEQLGLVRA
ncbi:hypothetical protein [Microbacterium sp. NPDC087591]|uniref:hypothetical protein n=1 Tax=Microbacterium sp. NPDC087591 TaxID=3364192 RepID=UPI003802B05E